jgi:hypothetical protein
LDGELALAEERSVHLRPVDLVVLEPPFVLGADGVEAAK